MNEIATKIILDPPKADIVLVFSASWYVWAGIGLIIVAVAIAFLPKKETPGK